MGVIAYMALTAAERDKRLAEILGENTLNAMDALRQAMYAFAQEPTSITLAEAVLARWEDVMCEHVNRTISVSGTIAAIYDTRITAGDVRRAINEQRLTDDEARIETLEEQHQETREEKDEIK